MPSRATLTTFDNAIEAHIIKGLLESEAIPVFLVGEQFFSAQMLFNAGLAHIRMQVPEMQLAQAKAILLGYKNGDFEQALTEEFNLAPVACPQCGSTETVEVSNTNTLAIMLAMTYFSGVAPKPMKQTICKQCKTKFD